MKFVKLKSVLVPIFLSLALVGGVSAQDLPNAKTAHKSLYKTNKRSTIVNILRGDLVPDAYKAALENAAAIQKYYEAMAVSPTEGMLAPSSSHAVNHHSAAAAHAAAISGCNSKKKTESDDCVVVAEFLPKGYSGPRAISLNAVASEEFSKKYRRAGKQKAFAVSPSTGFWGRSVKAGSIEAARAEALAECAKNSGEADATDCTVISEN